MAFAWIFASSFEDGTNGDWDSEADTGGFLDFPSYIQLARIPGMEVPFSGAYCMRWSPELTGDPLTGDTNDHTVTEGDLDIGDGSTAWLRFYLFIGNDFAATADDIFNIYEWQQTGGTVEAVISLQVTATTDAVDIAIADGIAASSNFNAISKGVWHCIEAKMKVSTGSAGTLDLIIDGVTLTSLTGLTNAAAVGSGTLGTQNTETTTTGTLLFDEFVFDDAQIFPIKNRFSFDPVFTLSGHAFVGPGSIDGAALLTSSGSNIMRLWDTDRADTNDAQGFLVELDESNRTSITGPLFFQRGCYVTLAGTNPRGQVFFHGNNLGPGHLGPRYHSLAGMRRLGLARAL